MYDKDSFTGRLNQLYSESGLTLDKFAKKCKVSRAAMQNYINGDRTPDSSRLIDFCKAFDISADWVLGLSDVRNPSAEVKGVVKFTGLSEKVIKRITDKDDLGEYIDEINHFIEIPYFRGFIKEYKLFLSMLQRFDLVEDNRYEENEDGKIVLSKSNSVLFIMRNLERCLTDITEEDFYQQFDVASKNTQAKQISRFEEVIVAAENNPELQQSEDFKNLIGILEKYKRLKKNTTE